MHPSVVLSSSLDSLAKFVNKGLGTWLPTTTYIGLFDGEHLPLLPVLSTENPNSITLYRWGFRPYWVKNHDAYIIEARGRLITPIERVMDTPSYLGVVQQNRCVVLVDGYVDGESNQYISTESGEPLLLLAIWNDWADPAIPWWGKDTTVTLLSKVDKITDTVTGATKQKRVPIAVTPSEAGYWLSELKHEQSAHGLINHFSKPGKVPLEISSTELIGKGILKLSVADPAFPVERLA
jgi:putative SOS response-associated peptidase YedK